MTKLKPCPFCGKAPKLEGPYPRDDRRYFVMIPDCRCHDMEIDAGYWYERNESDSMAKVASEWNTRAAPPVQWISASEQAPTEEDGDAVGNVWQFRKGADGVDLVHYGRLHFNIPRHEYLWARTGLVRPEGPIS